MKILKYVSSLALVLLLSSSFAFAQSPPPLGGGGNNPPAPVPIYNPLGDTTLLELINRIVGFAIGLLIAISVLFIIYAAYLYMFAGGDPKNVSQAKNIITYTVIAIIIALMSQVLVGIVIALLGGGGGSPDASFSPVEKTSLPSYKSSPGTNFSDY